MYQKEYKNDNPLCLNQKWLCNTLGYPIKFQILTKIQNIKKPLPFVIPYNYDRYDLDKPERASPKNSILK